MKRMLWLAVATLALAVPGLATAADGYVTANVNMRAGPDTGYPQIAVIPAGTPVAVNGCTSGWEWCDVSAGGGRGWVAGDFIQYDYQNQRVLLPAYGARIGIPIISFSIGTYWSSHYRNRPFYRNRSHWESHPPRHAPPRSRHPAPPHRAPPHVDRRAPARMQHPAPRPPVNHRPPTHSPASGHGRAPASKSNKHGDDRHGHDRNDHGH